MPLLSNPRRERFAQRVAETGNGAAAYRQTYGVHGASAEVGASRLLRNDKVQRRVREFQGEAAKAAVMTLEEIRLFLAAVVRGAHPEAKMSDKLRAVELDAKLAGELREGIDVNWRRASGQKPITVMFPSIFATPRPLPTAHTDVPANAADKPEK